MRVLSVPGRRLPACGYRACRTTCGNPFSGDNPIQYPERLYHSPIHLILFSFLYDMIFFHPDGNDRSLVPDSIIIPNGLIDLNYSAGKLASLNVKQSSGIQVRNVQFTYDTTTGNLLKKANTHYSMNNQGINHQK